MAEEKKGFFKRLFRFGAKEERPPELHEVDDATTSTAIGNDAEPAPVAHTDAAASVIADSEAGASLDAEPGITPIKDVPPPPATIDGDAAAERASAEAAGRREELAPVVKERPDHSEEPLSAHSREIETAEPVAPAPGHADEPFPDPDAKQVRIVAPVDDAPDAGVFEAPGETFDDGGNPAEPLSDTPEPPPIGPEPVDRSAPESDGPERTILNEASGKPSFFARMRAGLARSSGSLTQSIVSVVTKRKLDESVLDDLEDILIRADLGVATATAITEKLGRERLGRDVTDADVRALLAAEVERVLEPVAQDLELDLDHQPHVILVVGVNGSGKTTTIGKISQKLYDAGFTTLLAAGDTFRAAAVEQLKIWGERTLSPVIYRPTGADAAGLAYDAYVQAKEQGIDVVLMDTAGRLQNKAELMEELAKIVRVLKKQDPQAPHTVLLTLDATTGQNALNQVEIFKDVAGVNGLVMTKLDGTARGGILVAIAERWKLPVYFIGVGEQVEDLEPFEARDFARSIAGMN